MSAGTNGSGARRRGLRDLRRSVRHRRRRFTGADLERDDCVGADEHSGAPSDDRERLDLERSADDHTPRARSSGDDAAHRDLATDDDRAVDHRSARADDDRTGAATAAADVDINEHRNGRPDRRHLRTCRRADVRCRFGCRSHGPDLGRAGFPWHPGDVRADG